MSNKEKLSSVLNSEHREDQQPIEPYIGPRPFRTEKADLSRFSGRDAEIDEIVALITSHRIVLIYAQSGAGKTSIINAGVIPSLAKDGFEVLPVARVQEVTSTTSPVSPKNSNNGISSQIENIYIYNAIQSLGREKPEIKPESISGLALFEFLDKYFPTRKNENSGEIGPQVLIFDQLEELFSFYPDNWIEQQRGFFEQVADSLDNNPFLRVIFIIREDFLAQLDPFRTILPERLRPRFRLERLRRDAAKKAIKGPFDVSGLTIDDNIIEKILDNLLNIQIEISPGNRREAKGEFIEPIHLQVVCQRLWQKSLGSTNISLNDLEIIGDVDKALEGFYEDVIHRASEDAARHSAKPHDAKIYEGDIRIWCEKKLITSTGTRSIVHRGPRLTGGIPNTVIDSLENNYLIRGEWKSGAKWYELTHDRLIKPVLDSNKRWKDSLQSKLKRNKGERSRILIISIGAFVALYTILLLSILPPSSIPNQDQDIVNVAVNPTTNMVYVTASNGNNRVVSIINGTTNEIEEQIPVQYSERPVIAVNPTTNMVYVTASNLENTISIINGTTNEVDHVPAYNDSASAIAVNPTTNMVYAASNLENTISIINGTTNQVVGHIEINGHSGDIAIDPTNNKIYAGKVSPREPIAVINGHSNVIVDHIGSGYVTKSIVNHHTNIIYAANEFQKTISIINGTTNEIEGQISVQYSDRSAIAVNPTTNMVYVTASNGNNRVVSIINGITHEVIADQIPVDYSNRTMQ